MNDIRIIFYLYASQCFTDKNAIQGVKKFLGDRDMTDEEIFETIALAGEIFKGMQSRYQKTINKREKELI